MTIQLTEAPLACSQKPKARATHMIKCLVWDLDNTLWKGIMLEDDHVQLRSGVRSILKELDQRGILQSIASRNDYDQSMRVLQNFGLDEYFLYPQIGWNAKSQSIKQISEYLNISLDTVAFIDDQPFELEEVKYSLPDVTCLPASNLADILHYPEMSPKFITNDSRNRRRMYLSEFVRNRAELDFSGPKEVFLETLAIEMKIFVAQEEDLRRAEELTLRTNQLNATGYTYSYEELNRFRQSINHDLIMVHLKDRYGDYGNIGLALLERTEKSWTLKLLLMSCRVMSRGVGAVLLGYIINQAQKKGTRLFAEFVSNGKNRIMEVTFRLSGFRETRHSGCRLLFELDRDAPVAYPPYIKVHEP